jgi:hypothetical protein
VFFQENDPRDWRRISLTDMFLFLNLCILSLWLYSSLDLGRFFSFLILYTVGKSPWTRDQPVARPLPACRTTQTQNKRTQTSMPRVEFEHTISVFEGVKTVHALDRAATAIGYLCDLIALNLLCYTSSLVILAVWTEASNRISRRIRKGAIT